jgi:hypothetical protein
MKSISKVDLLLPGSKILFDEEVMTVRYIGTNKLIYLMCKDGSSDVITPEDDFEILSDPET